MHHHLEIKIKHHLLQLNITMITGLEETAHLRQLLVNKDQVNNKLINIRIINHPPQIQIIMSCNNVRLIKIKLQTSLKNI
jgi:hypothetical protein